MGGLELEGSGSLHPWTVFLGGVVGYSGLGNNNVA